MTHLGDNSIPEISTSKMTILEIEKRQTEILDNEDDSDEDYNGSGSSSHDDDILLNQTITPPVIPSCKQYYRLDEASIVLGFFIGVLAVFIVWLIVNWEIFNILYEEIVKIIIGRRTSSSYFSASPMRENDLDDNDDLIIRRID